MTTYLHQILLKEGRQHVLPASPAGGLAHRLQEDTVKLRKLNAHLHTAQCADAIQICEKRNVSTDGFDNDLKFLQLP